ncbi:MAG: hypothetical protein ACTSVA_01220 [Candidatus Njordarchaeales archaeon]
MHLALVLATKSSQIASLIQRALQKFDISYEILALNEVAPPALSKATYLVIIGRDRDLLQIHQTIGDLSIPILGVNISGETSFLMEISIEMFERAIHHILNRDFLIEDITRIHINSEEINAFAINEVAIFPKRSASLIEYALFIDNNFVWRDHCDGVIIATPMGSTAYAMSAGGAIVSPRARVLEIVSVNSIDPSRRPLIVPDNSEILVKEINSRYTVEVIVDGIVRQSLESDYLVIKKAEKPLKLIRLPREKKIYDERILKKMRLGEEIMSLPPSAKFVLKVLEYEGPLTQKDLIEKTMLPDRTVRYALSLLISKGLVKEDLLNRDARKKIYRLSGQLKR